MLISLLLSIAVQPATRTAPPPSLVLHPAVSRVVSAAPAVPRLAYLERPELGVSLESATTDGPILRVSKVQASSTAERAGVLPGDGLIALGGKPIQGYESLLKLLEGHSLSSRTSLTIQRTLRLPLAERGFGEQGAPRLGIRLAHKDERWIVSSVEQGWPAAESGVRAGDELLRFEGRELSDFEELLAVVAELPPGHEFDLELVRKLEVTFTGSGERAFRGPGRKVVEGAERAEEPEVRAWPNAPEGHFVAPVEPGGPGTSGESQGESAEVMRALQQELAALAAELQALRGELEQLRTDLRARER